MFGLFFCRRRFLGKIKPKGTSGGDKVFALRRRASRSPIGIAAALNLFIGVNFFAFSPMFLAYGRK